MSYHQPPLAQLVRAQSLYLWGPWFESKRVDKMKTPNRKVRGFPIIVLLRLLLP